MELIFEFIAEIVSELIFEGSRNSKINKFIRYPLIALVIAFFSGAIFLMIFLSVKLWKENIAGAVFFLAVGILMLVASIKAFKKEYIKNKSDI